MKEILDMKGSGSKELTLLMVMAECGLTRQAKYMKDK